MRKQKNAPLTKKLSIHKDTVRLLTSNETDRVVGGRLPPSEVCSLRRCSEVNCAG